MMEELSTIDTAIVEELERVTSELETLERRLQKLEDLRESVSQEVYDRVHEDYLTRKASLEEEMVPLKEQAEAQYATIKEKLGSLEENARELALQKEEIELRKQLGEFTGDEYEAMAGEVQEKIDATEAGLSEASRLKALFALAFREGEQPESGTQPLPKPKTGEDNGPLPPEAVVEAPEPPPVPEEETLALDESTPPDSSTEPARSRPADDATMLIRWPKLVGQASDGSTIEYPVTGSETTLGRDPDNDIALSGKKISKNHAVIVLVEDGYEIRDLGSTAGTLVNGVQVSTWQLSNGDSVQLGDVVLVFMET